MNSLSIATPPHPYWQPKLGVMGETVTAIDELNQALHLIVRTPKGTVPLDPEFGCNLPEHLDKPEQQAIPAVIRVINKAIKHSEPRIIINAITLTQSTHGQRTLQINWSPTDQQNTNILTAVEQ